VVTTTAPRGNITLIGGSTHLPPLPINPAARMEAISVPLWRLSEHSSLAEFSRGGSLNSQKVVFRLLSDEFALGAIVAHLHDHPTRRTPYTPARIMLGADRTS
jgi:hypothetical protein